MSGSVDDEVVRMRFDNNGFERAVSSTISVLAKLKSSLSFSGADKGLDQIEAKASHLNLSNLASGVEKISSKFSVMGIIGTTALASIASKAVSASLQVAKSFTTGPIAAGFKNYETQIDAVQTILANTGLKGNSGLAQVNKALSDLNTYANKTIYNFSDMAKSIGTFTAAGVKLGPATQAIKGIANLAAASGSSADQASGAMYQLSQALAAGTFKLQDYNSVVNAGIGGKLFQTAIYNSAVAAKTLKNVKVGETYDQWTKAGNNFRSSLQKGFVTTKVLTQALASFTGDETAAQLKRQGYTAKQIEQTQQTARLAVDAATKIKTFSQLQDALKEEVATAYAAIFKTIFGNINQARDLFSKLHTSIENALTQPIYAFNSLLEGAASLGARTAVIKGFTNIIKALGNVLRPIKEAFREIFPAKTAEDLAHLANEFEHFTSGLKVSKTTAANLKSTFVGVFAVFDILHQVVSGVTHVFFTLFSSVLKGGGPGVLALSGHIGDLIVNFDKALKSGGALTTFFDRIAGILATPLQILGDLGRGFANLFSGFKSKDASNVTGGLDKINVKLATFQNALDKFRSGFKKLGPAVHNGILDVVKAFSNLGTAIANGLNSNAYANILSSIKVGLLGGILVVLKNFLAGGLGGFHVAVGEGFFGKLKETLDGTTGSLRAMQAQLKAKALLEIAVAMGVLAASLVVLASINPQKLSAALKAMAGGFTELLGAMAILTKISGSAGFVKIPLIAAALDLLAVAILGLSLAVKVLSTLSYDQLKKGLGAVAILLLSVSAAALIISKNSGNLISAGIGITAMAVAINILAIAVKYFSTLSYKELTKGLAGVAGSLIAIAIGVRLMPTERMVATGAGLLLISVALQGIYLAVSKFSELDWKTMARGLIGVAGALTAIALGMQLMPKGLILQAAGLAIIAGSLLLIQKAIVAMAKLSFKTLGKGLGAIAAALIVLAAGLSVMDASLPGAAALVLVAAALKILAPVIATLGNLPWGVIGKGLLVLAGALAILVVAGLGASVVAVGLLALSVAIVAFGGGLYLAGAGIDLFAKGLASLAKNGSAGIAVMLSAIKNFVSQIPAIAVAFANAFVKVLQIIGSNGPAIVAALGAIVGSLVKVVIKNAPGIAKAVGVLIQQFLGVLIKNGPSIVAAGFALLMDLLNGIKNNIGKIVNTVADIITGFLNALANNIGKIIDAGVNLLTKFLVGVASALGKTPAIALKVIVAFVSSLVSNFGKIISLGGQLLGKLISGIGNGLGKLVSLGKQLIGKLISGITGAAKDLATAGIHAVGKVASGIGGAASSLVKSGANLASKLIGGIDLKTAFAKLKAEALALAQHVGNAIVDGIVAGVAAHKAEVANSLAALATTVNRKLKSDLKIQSPSKVTAEIGKFLMLGLSGGIDDNAKHVYNSLGSVTKKIANNFSNTNKLIPDMSDINATPVIAPVLDLTNVRKNAALIPDLLTMPSIKPESSFNWALGISAAQKQSLEDLKTKYAEPTQTVTPAAITFKQYNNSPESLSTIEIYRQTRNQLSQAKSALGLP